jgi:cobalt/nickel transport system ATP-binding protein
MVGVADGMSAILSLQNAGYRYPCGVQALTGINWSLEAGRRVAVVGGNGAGKSTFLLCLQGLRALSEGTLCLDGQPLGRDRAALRLLRTAVGLLFQHADDQLFAGDVTADVSYGPLNLGWSPERIRQAVHDMLQDLDLGSLRDRPLHALSHGERKLVALAGVLVMQPRALLLDEPTAGLDAAGEDALASILARLQARGLALVISTHDMDFAAAWADEVLVFKSGRLLGHGTPREILAPSDLLRHAELACPWAYAIAQQVWPHENAWPRTRAEVLRRLSDLRSSTGQPAATHG